MKFIQMHHTVSSHDAIGNDIEIISRILSEKNESYVYAEVKKNDTVKYIEEDEFDNLTQDEETTIIYHHSVYWDNGYEKLKNAKCRIIFKYHNITPEVFYESVNVLLYNQSKKGREQTQDFIKDFPDAYWICDSLYNSYDLVGVPKEKISICAPFNKIEEWSKIEPKEYILENLIEEKTINILFVGRVAPNKGHLMMLDVIKCYKDYYGGDIKLRIIGKFLDALLDYNKLIKEKIEEYDLSDNIEFIGEIDDSLLVTYYLGSDVMLICSDHEGYCVPVIEAQYFGLSIVALSKTAVTETIGENQVLLSDDVREYAAAIKVITENEEYMDYLEKQGRKNYRTRFSYEKMRDCFIDRMKNITGTEL